MLRLALIAALLMTIMPSLMRLSGHAYSGHEGAMSGMDMLAMHAMQGSDSMHGDTGLATPRHGAGPGIGQDDDCAYCPLLARTGGWSPVADNCRGR